MKLQKSVVWTAFAGTGHSTVRSSLTKTAPLGIGVASVRTVRCRAAGGDAAIFSAAEERARYGRLRAHDLRVRAVDGLNLLEEVCLALLLALCHGLDDSPQ